MPRITVASQLEKIRAARAKLEREEKKLLSRTHDKALGQIVQIARDAGLNIEQIAAALGGKTRAKSAKSGGKTARSSTAGRKVAPKYRDPANPQNTWTGRGRMPRWVADLEAKGELASAAISA
ncbi:MAG: hypothetical protein RIT26_2275 [Pseudomonadota bacterium]|jgi:DNA-binding protein H-NS